MLAEVTFTQATAFLQSRALPAFFDASRWLQSLSRSVELWQIVTELNLQGHPELSRLDWQTEPENYVYKLVEIISADICPLFEDGTAQSYLEDAIPQLYLYEVGMNSLTYDQYEGLMENLTAGDHNQSLTVFIGFLFMSDLAEEESWTLASETFGWGIDYEDIGVIDAVVDYGKLIELLKAQGMTPFVSSLAVSGGWTDNPFLTANCDLAAENGSLDGIEFTTENIQWLRSEWDKAKKILDEHEVAAGMADQDKAYFRRFLDAFHQSVKKGSA